VRPWERKKLLLGEDERDSARIREERKGTQGFLKEFSFRGVQRENR
jgi:hypothetical protein